jgi:D-amino-acid oxidase
MSASSELRGLTQSSVVTRPSPPRATVVGAGVIGLTTAITLQRHGFQVRIHARTTPLTAHLDPTYTSDKAGAHWFSFARTDETKKQAQDEIAFYALMGLAVTAPNSGVQIMRAHALFETPPSAHLAKPWWHNIVPRFRVWTPEELAAKSQENGIQYVHGFSYETVMISAPHYLQWLYDDFIRAGGEIEIGEVKHLRDVWDPKLVSASNLPSVVVNCCGLGASTLDGVLDTSMQPIRGQTIKVLAPGLADIWRAPGKDTTYILPRGDGVVVLGGTQDRGNG